MADKLKKKLKMWAIVGILILNACVGVSKVARVSNTVNGRELPIYSVETDEKKVHFHLTQQGERLFMVLEGNSVYYCLM